MAGAVRVKGLRELNRALTQYNRDLKKDLRDELKVVGEPVRMLAQELAVGNITNIGAHWSQMRLGITARSVYVAPRARNAGGSSRGNLAPLMMDEALQPALDARTDDVLHGLEEMLDRLGNEAGF